MESLGSIQVKAGAERRRIAMERLYVRPSVSLSLIGDCCLAETHRDGSWSGAQPQQNGTATGSTATATPTFRGGDLRQIWVYPKFCILMLREMSK
jgi:hypothetical protein